MFDPDRVDRAVEEASRVLGEVGSSTGGASTNSSNEARGGAGAAPDVMGESVNADRLTRVIRELSETERALERLGATMYRNAESLGASTNALRLSMEEKDTLLLLRKKTLDMVKPRLAEISSRRGEGPDSLKGQMGVIDDAVRLVRDIDRRVLQLDAVIAEDRPNAIANEGVRMERQLERLTASAERLRKAARRLMRNSGDGVYKIRLADRDAPPPPPWIRRTRPGREVVTYMTNQRAVAMQAQREGYSVLGLDADDDLSSQQPRKRNPLWGFLTKIFLLVD